MVPDVTTVLFDLDETLCEYPRPGRERLAEAFERASVEPCFTYDEYLREVAEVGGTESDVRRRESCFARLAARNGRDEAVGLRVADAYEALTDYAAMEPLPDARRVLDELSREYRIGLVTNGGPDTQSPKIDALGIRDRFETVVLAGYETAAKPDPEPFRRALADLDASAREAVYVGNSLSSDVAGANRSGLRSVWKPHDRSLDATPDADPGSGDGSATGPKPDHRIGSLRELLDRPWEEAERSPRAENGS